jgi:SPASM domain peptide maturase of grasp-with-spasm system
MNLKLNSNCIPINGSCRSLIVDFKTKKILPIPNALYEILKFHDGKTISETQTIYENRFDEIIEQYYNYLIKNDILFKCDKEECFYFPEISLDFEEPSIISNSIVEYKDILILKRAIDLLDSLFCKAVQIRLEEFNNSELDDIMHHINKSNISNVELIFKQINVKPNFKDILLRYPRIAKIVIGLSANNTVSTFADSTILETIQKVEQQNCGFISQQNFNIHFPSFCESLNYNSCLNKKVCINDNGFIKNCLSMSKHYGNINDVDLKEVVQSEEFQKLWHIKKDDIKVCKVCEFRHICMDCRAFIKDPNIIYSQPAKCNYNPYIAKWKGEERYITVEEWHSQQKVTN